MEVIRIFHDGMRACERNDDGRCSEWFEVAQGFRERCLLSSLLFTVTGTANLSDEMNRRIRVGYITFGRYMRKMYDRPKVCLLRLKVRMVRFEVVEALQ